MRHSKSTNRRASAHSLQQRHSNSARSISNAPSLIICISPSLNDFWINEFKIFWFPFSSAPVRFSIFALSFLARPGDENRGEEEFVEDGEPVPQHVWLRCSFCARCVLRLSMREKPLMWRSRLQWLCGQWKGRLCLFRCRLRALVSTFLGFRGN